MDLVRALSRLASLASAARVFLMSIRWHVPPFAAACLLAPFGGAQNTAPGGQLEWSDLPDAEAWAEDLAVEYAIESGNYDLANAIIAGEVNVYPGNVPSGPAVSWRGQPGQSGQPRQPATIIVQWTPSGEWVGVACVYEWSHISSDEDPPGSDCEPTEDQQQQHACDECKAHCEALKSMRVRFLEAGFKSQCAVKMQVVQDMRAECHVCAVGVNGYGPPNPEPCEGVSSDDFPCTP